MGAPDNAWGNRPSAAQRRPAAPRHRRRRGPHRQRRRPARRPHGGHPTGKLQTPGARTRREIYALASATPTTCCSTATAASRPHQRLRRGRQHAGLSQQSQQRPADRRGRERAYSGTPVQGLTNVSQTSPDLLYDVVQGGYYGHPTRRAASTSSTAATPRQRGRPEVAQYTIGTDPTATTAAPPGTSARTLAQRRHRVPRQRLRRTPRWQDPRRPLQRRRRRRRADAGRGRRHHRRAKPTSPASRVHQPARLIQAPGTGNLYVVDYGAQKIVLARPIAPGATSTSTRRRSTSTTTTPAATSTPAPPSGSASPTPAPSRCRSPAAG